MNATTHSKNIRTDLAIEQLEMAKTILPAGVSQAETIEGGVRISKIQITDPASANILGKEPGTYITIEPSDFQHPPIDFEAEVQSTAAQISSLLPHTTRSALVVGLGNASITPDALGPRAMRYLLVTRHFQGHSAAGLEHLTSVSAVAPGVLGQTGIESAQVISAICKEIQPDVVIVLDALASRSMSRLGKTLQLSDSGISPGSGVMNQRRELNRHTLGIPVLSLGVPTVVDLHTIVSDYLGTPPPPSEQVQNLFVTPKEIDLLIEHAAKTAAYAINLALHPSLSVSEIAALVS